MPVRRAGCIVKRAGCIVCQPTTILSVAVFELIATLATRHLTRRASSKVDLPPRAKQRLGVSVNGTERKGPRKASVAPIRRVIANPGIHVRTILRRANAAQGNAVLRQPCSHGTQRRLEHACWQAAIAATAPFERSATAPKPDPGATDAAELHPPQLLAAARVRHNLPRLPRHHAAQPWDALPGQPRPRRRLLRLPQRLVRSLLRRLRRRRGCYGTWHSD